MFKNLLRYFRDYRIILLVGVAFIFADSLLGIFLVTQLTTPPVKTSYIELKTEINQAYKNGELSQSLLLSKLLWRTYPQTFSLADMSVLIDSSIWSSQVQADFVENIIAQNPEWQTEEIIQAYNCYLHKPQTYMDVDCGRNIDVYSPTELLKLADDALSLSLPALSLVYSRELTFRVPDFYQGYLYQSIAYREIGNITESERLYNLSTALNS